MNTILPTLMIRSTYLIFSFLVIIQLNGFSQSTSNSVLEQLEKIEKSEMHLEDDVVVLMEGKCLQGIRNLNNFSKSLDLNNYQIRIVQKAMNLEKDNRCEAFDFQTLIIVEKKNNLE